MKKTLLAAILLGFSITASGQWVMGAGATDCGEMIADDRMDRLKGLYTNWIQGYLSALNQEGYMNRAHVGEGLSPDAIYFSVLNVCRENPTWHVTEAIRNWRRTQ